MPKFCPWQFFLLVKRNAVSQNLKSKNFESEWAQVGMVSPAKGRKMGWW
jgi:hypothetical protein